MQIFSTKNLFQSRQANFSFSFALNTQSELFVSYLHSFEQHIDPDTKTDHTQWGLTFSITEHCFGHQIVNFSPIKLIIGGYAPF